MRPNKGLKFTIKIKIIKRNNTYAKLIKNKLNGLNISNNLIEQILMFITR